uniref:Ribosomal protein L32 n=1 Tax=Romanomermis culicivorax TaxID=13658 RepID=A0A915HQL9_ROMCU
MATLKRRPIRTRKLEKTLKSKSYTQKDQHPFIISRREKNGWDKRAASSKCDSGEKEERNKEWENS